MIKKQKILIYGGTFDPPHLGHKKMFVAAINQIKPSLSFIIPNKFPPLKDEIKSASANERYNMCKIAFKNIKNTVISRIEIDKSNNNKSYTYLTIKAFKRKYKNAKIYFLIGSDQALNFSKWRNYQFILDNATVIVGARHKNESLPSKFHFVKLKFPPIDISSTDLRVNPLKKYMDINIVKYIANSGIYCVNQIKQLMSKYRFDHTIRVTETALQIAKANHYTNLKEVYLAAMYHDVCKEFNEKQTLDLVKPYLKKYSFPTIHTMHGLAASIYIQKHFNITNKKVINAVANHVFPIVKNDKLSKIIYLADKLEPARTKQDVSDRVKLFKLACKDIDITYNQLKKEINTKYEKK